MDVHSMPIQNANALGGGARPVRATAAAVGLPKGLSAALERAARTVSATAVGPGALRGTLGAWPGEGGEG